METYSESTRIVRQLSDFYEEDNWVTENFKQKVLSISSGDALRNVNGHTHAIAALVAHMYTWRYFVLQKLTGNDSYDIKDNSEDDWPIVEDWHKLTQEFDDCHQALIKAIRSFPADRLDDIVPLRRYTFSYLINGILEHDFYHSGQIGSILAEINRQSS